jgi:hypothetical protein
MCKTKIEVITIFMEGKKDKATQEIIKHDEKDRQREKIEQLGYALLRCPESHARGYLQQ